MLVDASSWHARVYRSWYIRKYKLPKGWATPANSNLCPYVRAVLFWSWMRPLFLSKAKWVAWPLLAIEVPRWVGMVSYEGKLIFHLAEAVFLGFWLLVGACIGVRRLSKFLWNSQSAQPLAEIGEKFAELLVRYGRAAHDGVCPRISFIKPRTSSGSGRK